MSAAICGAPITPILPSGGPRIFRLWDKGGYFYEYDLQSRDELCETVDEKYQTQTHFEIDPEKARESVIRNRLLGINCTVRRWDPQ